MIGVNENILATNFRLLYFAVENIMATDSHDNGYWKNLERIMYAEIDKNPTYNKDFLKHSMTQVMMFYCKEDQNGKRNFYNEVCKPIYEIVKEHVDDMEPMEYYANSYGKLNMLLKTTAGKEYSKKTIVATTDLLDQLQWKEA